MGPEYGLCERQTFLKVHDGSLCTQLAGETREPDCSFPNGKKIVIQTDQTEEV
jgi:hypothetical protein